MKIGRHDIFEERGRAGVLVVHGITGAPTEMKPLVRKLASSDFTVYCPQLAGHCSTLKELKQTHWTDWYATLERSLEVLRERCDSVFVTGLSMGALLALKIAANHSDRVDGVATLSATFFYDGWNVPRLRERFLLPLAIYSPLRFFWSYREPSPYGIKDERVRKLAVAAIHNGTDGAQPMIGFPGTTVLEFRWLAREARRVMAQVRAPALIIHPRHDDFSNLRGALLIQQRLSSRVETLVLDDSYHMVTIDRQRDLVVNRTLGFVAALQSATPASELDELPLLA